MSLIRPGCAEDIEAIAAIQSASAEAAQWAPSGYLGYDLHVAEEDGRVIAFAVTRTIGPGEIELLNVAVTPEFRRRGIGRGLIESVLQMAKTQTNVSVFLEVRASNQAARSLYKSLDFHELGVREKYYENPPESAIVMKFHSC